MHPDAPYFSISSVQCQTILLIKWRMLPLNGLTHWMPALSSSWAKSPGIRKSKVAVTKKGKLVS